MNKVIVLFLLTCCFSCNLGSDSSVFDSKKLNGKYKVDLSSFINQAMESEGKDDDVAKLGKGIAALMFSSLSFEIGFYEEHKGIFYFDGAVLNFLSAFSDKPITKIHAFDYKLENDNVLYLKNVDETEYEEVGTIRTFTPNYDYIQIAFKNDDGKEVTLDFGISQNMFLTASVAP